MKNTFGQSIALTLFGESHGEAIGVVIDGLAPGIAVNKKSIEKQLDKRRPYGAISTQRKEKDKFQIVSGVFNGKTTGTPLCIIIPNEDTNSSSYEEMKNLPRPSHADYTAQCKYRGFQDYRGGGHFSGRLTAPITAAGAIALDMLAKKGIFLGTHIKCCGGVYDRDFLNIGEDIDLLNDRKMPVLDEKSKIKIEEKIVSAASEGDSVGGILETAVIGLPTGLGEPWFDSFEGVLSHGIFSIPAVKGVEFGLGFGFSDKFGSEANDAFALKDNRIITLSNNNGGINGGITNGMPVIFRCAVKPTPSVYKEQRTVDTEKSEEKVLKIKGRHDPAIIHRAAVVVNAVTALTVCDMLALRYGTDYFAGE